MNCAHPNIKYFPDRDDMQDLDGHWRAAECRDCAIELCPYCRNEPSETCCADDYQREFAACISRGHEIRRFWDGDVICIDCESDGMSATPTSISNT